MANLGDLIVRVGAEISDFQSAMRGVQDELRSLDSNVGKTGESISATFNTAMQGIADHSEHVREQFSGIEKGAMSLLIAGAELYEAFTEPLKKIAEASIEAAAETEKLQIVMTTLLGSSNLAGGFVEELHKFAGESPLALPSLEKGAQRLLAFQFAGKDVIPILKTLGDVSTAFGQGDEGVGTLVGIMGKIEETGSVSGRLVNSLKQFGGISALSLGLGKGQDETMAMVKAGSIDSTTGINALMKGWDQMFGGTAQSEMAGFSGMMANLKNQVTLTLDEIGKSLLPVGKLFVEWAKSGQEAIRGLAQWFGQLPGPVQATAASMAALVASLGPIALGLAGIGFLIPNLIIGVQTIAAVFGMLRTVLAAVAATVAEEGIGAALVGAFSAPALLIPVAIAAIVAALAALATWVYTHWDGVKAAVSEAWGGVKELWEGTLGAAINWVMTAFELMGSKLGIVWSGVEESQKSAFGRMLDAAKSFWDKLNSDVMGPMMTSLKIMVELLPGGQHLGNIGTAFSKGEADAKEGSDIASARKTLHMDSGGAPHISDSREAWMEKHRAAVDEAAAALGKMRKAYEDNKISVQELTKATEAFKVVYNEKPPVKSDGTAGKIGKDRSAIDAATAEHAHEESEFARQRSAIEHEFQLSKPGSVTDAFTSAVIETDAAAKRRQQLDAVAKEELDATNRTIDAKLAGFEKLYAKQKDGATKLKDEEVKLNGERMASQDKYAAEILKNKQTEETVQKQVNDRLDADTKRTLDKQTAERKRAADEEERMAKQHADAMAQIAEIMRSSSTQHEEALRAIKDENYQHELDIGAITRNKYLDLKQQQFDEAYRIEKEFVAKERQLLAQEEHDLLASASDPLERERITDDFGKRHAQLAGREQQTDDKHALNTAAIKNEKELGQYNAVFKPFETSFASSITALVEGTKTFKQAWLSMVSSMLNSWISSLAQMAARWVAHKLFELAFHVITNEAKVASDAGAAAQSRSISMSAHMHEVLLHAHTAAAAAFKAVAGIPLIGPILAPIAAAGAYVAVLGFGAVSAERGAVLPNENTIAFLHPKEMVLPSHISEGLQSAIGGGGLGSTNNFHGDVNYHASAGEKLTVDTFHGMFMQMLRMKNLRMA